MSDVDETQVEVPAETLTEDVPEGPTEQGTDDNHDNDDSEADNG